ncbi:MAG: hypothetical protein NPINA01_15510 [Nitrospinaceae bacterium]|nr:MAG: hypothetical protein NPINA01_15510 [Nitrospinaceae bacterium]
MLIFAKDISERDHKHALEDRDPELKTYMEYQRKLFPYTIVRAGLDLAYKELDDILVYIDNDYQPPADSSRKEYPADVDQWYRARFPWASSFIKMEDMHFALVTMVKAMDSFRTEETPNAYHLAILYDAVHNIVAVYNSMLKENANQARDIHLSSSVPVSFDDFINNYWPRLDFMILSQPDFPHAAHMPRNREIEDAIKNLMADGIEPLKALEQTAGTFDLKDTTLALLRRDSVKTGYLELKSGVQREATYDGLKVEVPEGSHHGKLTVIDASYLANFERAKKLGASLGENVQA